MPLLGTAAVAMWWDMAPALRSEFQDWHSHEHFPERMSVPGFRRGSRWASEQGEGFFVLYELEDYETLVSPHYLSRLNDPTPWSTKMMPHHRNMVRSQCRILASAGGGVSRFMLTLRFSPSTGQADLLEDRIKPFLESLPTQPGVTGAHLLRTETPEHSVATREQMIRGGDAAADWIVLVGGYDAEALKQVMGPDLGSAALQRFGAIPTPTTSLYSISYAMTPLDI